MRTKRLYIHSTRPVASLEFDGDSRSSRGDGKIQQKKLEDFRYNIKAIGMGRHRWITQVLCDWQREHTYLSLASSTLGKERIKEARCYFNLSLIVLDWELETVTWLQDGLLQLMGEGSDFIYGPAIDIFHPCVWLEIMEQHVRATQSRCANHICEQSVNSKRVRTKA